MLSPARPAEARMFPHGATDQVSVSVGGQTGHGRNVPKNASPSSNASNVLPDCSPQAKQLPRRWDRVPDAASAQRNNAFSRPQLVAFVGVGNGPNFWMRLLW